MQVLLVWDICASADAAIGFSDGGLLTGMGADIGKKVSSDFANSITSDTNTSPDRTISVIQSVHSISMQPL